MLQKHRSISSNLISYATKLNALDCSTRKQFTTVMIQNVSEKSDGFRFLIPFGYFYTLCEANCIGVCTL